MQILSTFSKVQLARSEREGWKVSIVESGLSLSLVLSRDSRPPRGLHGGAHCLLNRGHLNRLVSAGSWELRAGDQVRVKGGMYRSSCFVTMCVRVRTARTYRVTSEKSRRDSRCRHDSFDGRTCMCRRSQLFHRCQTIVEC